MDNRAIQMKRFAQTLFFLAFLVSFSFASDYSNGYQMRAFVNCTLTTNGTPVSPNGTYGVKIGNDVQTAWIIAQPNLYIYANSSPLWVINNATARVVTEVERGNVSSFGDYYTMWRNTGAVGVFHFGETSSPAIDSVNYNNLTWAGLDNTTSVNAVFGKGTYIYNPTTGGGTMSVYMTNTAAKGLPSGAGNSTEQYELYKNSTWATDHGIVLNYGQRSGNGIDNDVVRQCGITAANQTDYYGTWDEYVPLMLSTPSAFTTYTSRLTSQFAEIWENGTQYASKTFTGTNTGIGEFDVGAGYTNYASANKWIYGMRGIIDELRIYNSSKSNTFINETIFNKNAVAGYCNVEAWEYNVTPAQNFTFVSQVPADLTSTNFIGTTTNITFNVSNLTSGTPILRYKANNSTSDNFFYINGTTYSGFQGKTCVNYGNNSTWSCLLNDNQIAPATYNLNEVAVENTPHSELSTNTQNSLVGVGLENVSIKKYNIFEIMSNGTTSNAKTYYYCNSSYVGGVALTSSPNCVLIGSLAANAAYNHTHTANSKHIIIPFAINTTNGQIAGSSVKVTPISYFFQKGAIGGSTNTYYVANFSRSGAAMTSTNNGLSLTNQTYTFDSHLHQFDGSDAFHYYLEANLSGSLLTSIIYNDTFELDPLAPTAPIVLTPTSGDKYGIVSITWLAAQNLTPQTISYNVSLYNDDGTFNSYLTTTNSTSYSWNTASIAHLPYFIRVTATNNYSQSSFADSENFTIATFTATAISPTSGSAFAGNEILFSYSQNSDIAPATCQLRIDGVTVDTNTNLSGTYSALATLANGSHYWVVNCSDTEGAGYTSQSTNRTFTINYYAFNTQANLTSSPENVLSSPQAMFYDINGHLNVLYFTDEGTSRTARIKTISGSTVTNSANVSLEPTNQFFIVFRNPSNTTILTTNASNLTQAILLTLSGSSLTYSTASFPSANSRNLTVFDAYTYANTKQFTTLSPTASSYWLFTTPLSTGSNITKYYNNTLSNVQTFVNSVSGQWQTIANDSAMTQWIYAVPYDIGGSNAIHLYSYNGTAGVDIGTLDSNGYSASALSAAIVGFEKYNGSTYAYATNLTRTTIHLIEENKTYQLNETITNPSYFFFIDKYTFVFFASSGGDTYAYTCYFEASPICERFASADYGLAVPYEQGFMSSAKRESNNDDTVVRGMIQSGSVVSLNYNTNTYDMKFICYNERNDDRKTFKQRTLTATSAVELANYTWGYVLPSASVGTGVMKYYSTCLNGTQRLFLSGLSANFSIDEYTLDSSIGTYYSFTVKDRYGVAIPDVKVSMLRYSTLKQGFVVIEQCLSDFNGGCTFFLEPYQPYKILIEANGYVTQYVDFVPSSVTAINIALDPSGASFSLPSYNYMFDDVTSSLTPISTLMTNKTNITYTVSSNGSNLQWFGMEVYKTVNSTRTQVYNQNTSTQPSGGSLLYEVNSSGRYDVRVYYKHQNYSQFEPFTRSYTFQIKSGLVKTREAIEGSANTDGWAIYFVGVVITMLVVGFVSRYTIDGAGVVGLVVLWGFTMLNPSAVIYSAGIISITTTIATIVTSIVTIAALYIRYSAQTGG